MSHFAKILSARNTYVIAEAGVNHNGSEERAFELLAAAVDAGADAFKVQIFDPENLVTGWADKAEYQEKNTGDGQSQLEMLRQLDLDRSAYSRLLEECNRTEIDFLVTPFDVPGIRFLREELGLAVLKVPSGEITNAHFLYHAASSGADLIVSTGMSTLDEVRFSLGVVSAGYERVAPSVETFDAHGADPDRIASLYDKVALLHCTTQYPTPFEDINLQAMPSLKDTFGLSVGLSDHSKGISVPIAAVGIGASIIEKHFTLSRDLPGPDHKASLEPGELRDMIRAIREIEQALGDGAKRARPSEEQNIEVARRSIYATGTIRKGDTLSEANITTKRPGSAMPAKIFWSLIGATATRDYEFDEAIDEPIRGSARHD